MHDFELSLEPIIRQYVTLSTQASSKGWYSCICPVCKDYKKRAAFRFDGPITSYNCFNCNHAATHDPTTYKTISNNMIEVMDCFLIPDNEYNQLIFNACSYQRDRIRHKPKVVVDPDTSLHEIHFPDYFVPLKKIKNDKWANIAREYLTERMVDPNEYDFHILSCDSHDPAIEKKWRARLIIPYYRSKKVVWYQGRDLKLNSKMRYISADSPSECILSDHAQLFKRTTAPLFITEGFFDSFMVNGVAIFGNTFKKGQVKLLQSSSRRKVYVPDNSKDAKLAAIQALANGWEVSIPDVGSCKDLNSAVKRYGKLYVMKTLYDNIISGTAAQVRINTIGC